MQQILDNDALLLGTIYRWVGRFKGGTSWITKTCYHSGIIEKKYNVALFDRRVKVEEIASTMGMFIECV